MAMILCRVSGRVIVPSKSIQLKPTSTVSYAGAVWVAHAPVPVEYEEESRRVTFDVPPSSVAGPYLLTLGPNLYRIVVPDKPVAELGALVAESIERSTELAAGPNNRVESRDEE